MPENSSSYSPPLALSDAQQAQQVKGGLFIGRNYERADMRGRDLSGVNFTSGNFRGADFTGSDLRGAIFANADLSRACLHKVDARGANFSCADLTNAYLKGANFQGANFWNAYLKGVISKNAKFEGAILTGADVARGDFLGSRFDDAVTDQMSNLDAAFFYWFLSPGLSGRPFYRPFPGAMVMTESQLGAVSYQENAGLGKAKREYKPGDPEWFAPVEKEGAE